MRKVSLEQLNHPMNIGIFGLHPHAGATRVTVLVAEYLSNICGKRVAVMEHGMRRDLNCLNPMSTKKGDDCFDLHKITFGMQENYHAKTSYGVIPYDCYVYDLGCNYARSRELIQACDRTLLLFTMTPWHFDTTSLRYAIQRDYGTGNHIHFIGNMIEFRERKQIHKIYNKVDYLGYEPDLYAPSKDAVRLFHEILWN